MKNLVKIIIVFTMLFSTSFSFGQSAPLKINNQTEEGLEFRIFLSYCGGTYYQIISVRVPPMTITTVPPVLNDPDLKWFAYHETTGGADNNPYYINPPYSLPPVTPFYTGALSITWNTSPFYIEINY